MPARRAAGKGAAITSGGALPAAPERWGAIDIPSGRGEGAAALEAGGGGMDVRREVVEFLLARRSRPPKLLTGPGPDRAALETLLTAAARVPDHGKLEPWRFVVLGEGGSRAFAQAIRARAEAAGQDPDKGALAFEQAPVTVAVIGCPRPSEKIPAIEQTLSAGAVCLSLLNAALASGWGASWLTGWAAYDRPLLEGALGLAPEEWIAGFIHLGTARAAPPERPRPDLDAVVDWRP
jgi:nitroreductase